MTKQKTIFLIGSLRVKVVVLMLVVLCCTLCGCKVARCELFSCFVLFVILFLCLVDPVLHCDRIVGKKAAGCYALFCLWLVYCLSCFFFFVFFFSVK